MSWGSNYGNLFYHAEFGLNSKCSLYFIIDHIRKIDQACSFFVCSVSSKRQLKFQLMGQLNFVSTTELWQSSCTLAEFWPLCLYWCLLQGVWLLLVRKVELKINSKLRVCSLVLLEFWPICSLPVLCTSPDCPMANSHSITFDPALSWAKLTCLPCKGVSKASMTLK